MFTAKRLVRFDHDIGDYEIVAVLGLLLTCGVLVGELLEAVKIPHLTAYLAVGVIAGPYVLKLVNHEMVDRLQTVNTLALALIAFAGGAELKIDLVKRSVRSLSASAFTQCVLVFVGATRDLRRGDAAVAVHTHASGRDHRGRRAPLGRAQHHA